ncbi:CcmD family protein [Fulvivirgaceae bacterium BMA10]|uniref:CcmD family protein n=1 Tax=Splendidivirga corallicola TaxID=3051826 RepID=A0ABT8KN63_9BACT|nr:CcmD family protein [Fulvivirgaceae bacterium BMA10]
MKKLLFIIIMLFSLSGTAQDKIEITKDDYTNQEVEMADRLRADGKIYVVVLVISVVMAGILFYLVKIDRQISRLEKEINNN